MEREACVCDHGLERSDLCAERVIIIIIIIIIIITIIIIILIIITTIIAASDTFCLFVSHMPDLGISNYVL